MDATRFSRNVSDLLSRITYSRALSRMDREAVFRLRYEANLREQTILPNTTGMLTDRYDDTSNCLNIGVHLDGKLAAALRLHLLHDEYADSPLLAAYPDFVSRRVEAGLRIIDITRLAADFSVARTEPHLAYATVRLSMLVSEHFGADIILAAVRREHIPFYRREFLATQSTEPRPYPTLVKPLCLFEIDYKGHRDAIVARHPFHASTHSEREALLGSSLWPALRCERVVA